MYFRLLLLNVEHHRHINPKPTKPTFSHNHQNCTPPAPSRHNSIRVSLCLVLNTSNHIDPVPQKSQNLTIAWDDTLLFEPHVTRPDHGSKNLHHATKKLPRSLHQNCMRTMPLLFFRPRAGADCCKDPAMAERKSGTLGSSRSPADWSQTSVPGPETVPEDRRNQ